MNIEALRFPIGKYEKPVVITDEMFRDSTETIRAFPHRLRQAVAGLGDAQLDTPYRPEGWTIRQVVHHCADSHLNAITRLKLALTETHPTIKPYKEALWAELPDAKMSPEISLMILDGVHARWVRVLEKLNAEDRKRSFYHPESDRNFSIEESTGLYAWHCNHHLAHITILCESKGWKS